MTFIQEAHDWLCATGGATVSTKGEPIPTTGYVVGGVVPTCASLAITAGRAGVKGKKMTVTKWNILVQWNILVLRNLLKAKRDGDMISYYYWKEMFV